LTLEQLNALDREAGEQVFLRCCGSTKWARGMAARRPFLDTETLFEQAERLWHRLDADDWLEAFAAHPRIGESKPAGGPRGAAGVPGGPDGTGGTGAAGGSGGTGGSGATGRAPAVDGLGLDWSAREQSGIVVAVAVTRQRLAAVNRDYEARFGFTYIVCATGKSAGEMLDIAERRLTHRRDEEIRIAAAEQLKITRLRLATLVSSKFEVRSSKAEV
jgi:2-oxo-4-hydroxy-4-carboxy-5-ureidoimidazoline decarboxylase